MTSFATGIQTAGSIIGHVILDATLSEVHRKTNVVTSHPVEDGANVSDHIQVQPDELEISGLVSDTPIVWLASLLARSPIDDDLTHPTDRADLAYQEMELAMSLGQTVEVITSLRDYEMVITGMTVAKDPTTGKTLPLSISLKEILTVETQTAAAPVAATKPKNAPVNQGKKTPATAPAANKAKTSQIFRSLF